MGLFEFFLIVILIGSIFISADGFKHDKERIDRLEKRIQELENKSDKTPSDLNS